MLSKNILVLEGRRALPNSDNQSRYRGDTFHFNGLCVKTMQLIILIPHFCLTTLFIGFEVRVRTGLLGLGLPSSSQVNVLVKSLLSESQP